MKKLMIAAAIICSAVIAQAASLKWGGAIADPNYATSGSYDDYQAYPATAMLLWSATAFTDAATKLDGATVGSTADNGGTVVQTYAIGSNEAENLWAFTSDYNKVGQDVNGYYAVLVTSGDGKSASYYAIGSVSGDATTVANLTVNATWGDTTFLQQGGYTATVAPEPTSGLLILLGMAGLALRRKRA